MCIGRGSRGAGLASAKETILGIELLPPLRIEEFLKALSSKKAAEGSMDFPSSGSSA